MQKAGEGASCRSRSILKCSGTQKAYLLFAECVRASRHFGIDYPVPLEREDSDRCDSPGLPWLKV
jgi:hypothetical protein